VTTTAYGCGLSRPLRDASVRRHCGSPPVTAARPICGLPGVGRRDDGETKIRPCAGRQTSSRARTQQDTTRTNQQVTADRPHDHHRPACQVRRSRASRALRSFPEATSSHPRSIRRASPRSVATVVTSSLRGLLSSWLGTTRRTTSAACRGGVRRWSTARGTGAAQTVWIEAASPSPTDQHSPGMLGKRTS
jgi:hypothetical protein